MDEEADREISDHVLRMQRYRSPGEAEGSGITSFMNLMICWGKYSVKYIYI